MALGDRRQIKPEPMDVLVALRDVDAL